MRNESLQIEQAGEIFRVSINRTEDRNSIDSDLMLALRDFLEAAEKTTARAVIFTGAGGSYFIGGADGVEMMQCSPQSAGDFSERIQGLFDRMEASPLILTAAISGLCFGGGFEFALACDLRLADETARIGLPEVKVGIIPGGGGTQRLPRLVGSGRATEMILSGKLYTGAEALSMGLIHRLAPAGRLQEQAQALLAPILRNPGHAVVQAKRALQASRVSTFTEGLRAERHAFARCFEHDFFTNLMHRQLREGSLRSTRPLPAGPTPERRDG
jgi:enoyl-CoA hydratase/carnithine racemase